MIVRLIAIGKTTEKWLQQGMEVYLTRLPHYISFEYIEIPDIKIPKGMAESEVKRLEGLEILKRIETGTHMILLDELGKEFNSVELSEHLQKRFNSGMKSLVLVIGGPYGFSGDVYSRANERMALSKLTFSHQMIRLFALEQIYRSMTILKNEPYHHR